MLRQRLRIGTSPFVVLGRIVLILAALALVWYGAMLVLLAFKVSPHTVNQLSRYRSTYSYLAALKPRDITTGTRLIAGLAGLAGFLVFGYLAFKELPRPHFTRSELRIVDDQCGVVDVAPLAIERVVQGAALQNNAVQNATARYATDALTVNISVTRAHALPDILRAVRATAHEQLAVHGLPELPVNVTVTGFLRTRRRELA
ncbi:MAG: hypothetical protein ACLP0J_16475 [Solirubrobacteraceae bacterium]